MPEYSLRQGASVAFPSGPLTIRAIPGLRIDVRARLDATVRTASRQPDLVVVPQLTGPCDVYLSRVDQASFTGAEQASLTFSSGERSLDPSVATLNEVHGEGQVEVLTVTLEPSATGIQISVIGTPDRPSGLAGLASDVTKRLVIGGAHANGKDVAVVLDSSASMRPWATSAAAVVAVLTGIDHAVGGSRGLEIDLGDGRWRRVDPAGAEQAVQQWAQRPTARSGSSAASRAPAEGFLTYLVSDAVPVDHDPQQDQRVVVLCRPGAWSLLDDGRTDKAIPIPVPVGTDLAESLAGDQRLLQEVVGRIADPLLTRGGAR